MSGDRITAEPPEHGSTVSDLLQQFVGLKLYGGCKSCDAHQTIAPLGGHGVFKITVHHDDWCPEQQGREGRL